MALLVAVLFSSIVFGLVPESSVSVPSGGYIHYPAQYAFGVVGSTGRNFAINNFRWLFSNQSMSYLDVGPSQVSDLDSLGFFDGLILWTKGEYSYNVTAIKLYAQTHVVIIDIQDFCRNVYPSLSQSLQVVSTSGVTCVTYDVDWGNFHAGDLVEMRNETENTNSLVTILTSSLTTLTSVNTIAHYDSTRTAFFHKEGISLNSGFYVMDLDATTPSTQWTGIWHLFPALKLVRDFPTGKYGRWLTEGVSLFTYDEIMSQLSAWVSSAPKGMNASLIRIGKSVLGRNINAARFGNGSRYIIVNAAIHGNERLPPLALLRLLEVVQEDFSANGHWKDRLGRVSMIVIPILNPDGYVADTRDNANGKDLNRQFPPATTTEPEAWALRWLWGNYSTFLYIDSHEGFYWYPSDYAYAPDLPSSPVDVAAFTNQNMYWAAKDFDLLNHWGYFTYDGSSTDIGKVVVGQGSAYGATHGGASLLYNITGYLLESFIWSDSYKARQQLYAMDFYISAILEMANHFDRLRVNNFLALTQGNVKTFMWNPPILRLVIDTSDVTNLATSVTKIDIGERSKPLHVLIDNVERSEGSGWTYNAGTISITGARNNIEFEW